MVPYTDPVVRFLSHSSSLGGSGTLKTQAAAPRGVINFGPENLTGSPANIEYNRVWGINIAGPGVSWKMNHSTPVPSNIAVRGSRGVCFDSGQAYGSQGSCYQNSIRDVTVVEVDSGVYVGREANGNSVSGVMMYGIGQYAYQFDGSNSENTVVGGFTSGFGNVTVIKCKHCMYNMFHGAIRTGPGSKYMDFDQNCRGHSHWT